MVSLGVLGAYVPYGTEAPQAAHRCIPSTWHGWEGRSEESHRPPVPQMLLVEFYKGAPDLVRFQEPWSQEHTYLDKLKVRLVSPVSCRLRRKTMWGEPARIHPRAA